MVGARGLSITWGHIPRLLEFSFLPESRFSEVAKLKHVWWLDVKARIETEILSPNTTYVPYFVFKLDESRYGFARRPVQLGIYAEGRDDSKRRHLFLDPQTGTSQLVQDRGDVWKEIEIGEFFNENGDDGKLICSVFDFQLEDTMHGLIIEGIELRPKSV